MLSDEEALAFHRQCVELELEQATKPPIDDKHIRTALREGTSPFVSMGQYAASLHDPDRRLAAKLSHDTIMLRSGLALGFIDPMTGEIRD